MTKQEVESIRGSPVAIIDNLTTETCNILNNKEFVNKHVFYLEWCAGHFDRVRFSWCMQRNYSAKGVIDDLDHFEICVGQTEESESDPWRRMTFFLWNEPAGLDGSGSHRLYAYSKDLTSINGEGI